MLRVKGEWKLGDLGGVVGFGEPIVSLQRDVAYRRQGAEFDAAAVPENDLSALAVVLERAQPHRCAKTPSSDARPTPAMGSRVEAALVAICGRLAAVKGGK